MRQLIFAMRFTGQAEVTGPDGKMLRATSSAPSGAITSTVGKDGLAASLAIAPGGVATFESEVTMTGETTFLETGAITFGEGNRLAFSTIGEGHVSPGGEPGTSHGAVMWRIEGGEGQFAGATGLITSNALLDATLGLVDHQFGVVHLP